MHKVSPTVAWL